ncbi:Rho termination factor N-terminal domain-containing protein [Alsobacter sp. KACC 23698]|uniref:Rho termination factor N-terminal domain-containing protein n=1 Tax=Alsobacter sp. KACC 23698 TaxID=3149229 RepID=A0AAU7JAT9_9HYPH
MRHVRPPSVSAGEAHPAHGLDPITEDLRSYALELGVVGASAMDKDELVESLRQYYVLRLVLEAALQPRPHVARQAEPIVA